MIEEILKLLKERLEVESRMCDHYNKSDDVGACYHKNVDPIKKQITYLENILNGLNHE